MYLVEYDDKCILGIMQSSNDLNLNILGVNFIRNYLVVFDNYRSRIGLIENNLNIRPYISTSMVLAFVKLACVGIIASTIVIFCTGKHRLFNKDAAASGSVFEMGTGVAIG